MSKMPCLTPAKVNLGHSLARHRMQSKLAGSGDPQSGFLWSRHFSLPARQSVVHCKGLSEQGRIDPALRSGFRASSERSLIPGRKRLLDCSGKRGTAVPCATPLWIRVTRQERSSTAKAPSPRGTTVSRSAGALHNLKTLSSYAGLFWLFNPGHGDFPSVVTVNFTP